MTGRVLARADYRVQVYSRVGTLPNHLRAIAFALIAAGFLTLMERSF